MAGENKINKRNVFNLFIGSLIFLNPIDAMSQELNSGDTAWILTSTALVLFMTFFNAFILAILI